MKKLWIVLYSNPDGTRDWVLVIASNEWEAEDVWEKQMKEYNDFDELPDDLKIVEAHNVGQAFDKDDNAYKISVKKAVK